MLLHTSEALLGWVWRQVICHSCVSPSPFLAFSLIPSHTYSHCLFLGSCERQCDNLSGISGKQVPSPQWLMWLNNCSNLANVFLGCRGRWPAAGYQALCIARLPNPAQGTWFPALQGPCRCLCCTLQVFMWCRGKKWWYARYFACPLSSPSAMSCHVMPQSDGKLSLLPPLSWPGDWAAFSQRL